MNGPTPGPQDTQTPSPWSTISGLETTEKHQTTICCLAWHLTHKTLSSYLSLIESEFLSVSVSVSISQFILLVRFFRSLLSEYLRIAAGSCRPVRNSFTSAGSFNRSMICVTLAREMFSILAISFRDSAKPSSSIPCHSIALWITCLVGN